MKNSKPKIDGINIVKCTICGEPIDTRKATTDESHEYVRWTNKGIYMHISCWREWEKELVDETEQQED